MTARILIIEDEALVAMELRFVLEDLGHEVVGTAADAKAAHALAAEHDGKPEGLPYEAFLRERAKADEQLEVVATPRGDAAEVYDEAFIKRYKGFEDRVASGDI